MARINLEKGMHPFSFHPQEMLMACRMATSSDGWVSASVAKGFKSSSSKSNDKCGGTANLPADSEENLGESNSKLGCKVRLTVVSSGSSVSIAIASLLVVTGVERVIRSSGVERAALASNIAESSFNVCFAASSSWISWSRKPAPLKLGLTKALVLFYLR